MRRRVPLRRSKRLQRSPLPRLRPTSGRPPTARSGPPTGTRRATGPDEQTRALVIARAVGRCERCGTVIRGAYSIHHRQPRGMGGTRDPALNSPPNLLLLCGTGTTGCHGWVEAHRAEATAAGFLVPRPADPAAVPVRLWDGRHVLLAAEGTYTPVRMDR